MRSKENPGYPKFVKMAPNWGLSTDRAKMYSILKVVRIHQQAKFETIPPKLCSQENARKSQIQPVLR